MKGLNHVKHEIKRVSCEFQTSVKMYFNARDNFLNVTQINISEI